METEKEVRITHTFNAGRELVFEAWTDPDQLEKWFAPNGCTIHFKKIDIQSGGTFHSCINNPEFGDCWCKGTYLEIDFPNKIVFTMEVADEHGQSLNPVAAGMPSDWPAITTVKVTFDEIDGKTEMTLLQTVSEALAKATGAHPSWIQMFERLEESFPKK